MRRNGNGVIKFFHIIQGPFPLLSGRVFLLYNCRCALLLIQPTSLIIICPFYSRTKQNWTSSSFILLHTYLYRFDYEKRTIRLSFCALLISIHLSSFLLLLLYYLHRAQQFDGPPPWWRTWFRNQMDFLNQSCCTHNIIYLPPHTTPPSLAFMCAASIAAAAAASRRPF